MYRFTTAAVLLAAVLLAAPVLAQQPFELKTEGDSLTLTIGDDGIAMVEFVKLAERLTGRVFTFSKKEIAGAEPVKLIGSVRMKKDAFLSFFQTRLYVEGFATRIRDKGDTEVIEIISARRSGHHRPSDAKYVVAAELEGHKADTATVSTSIALAHVAPQLAIERVRAALAATANDATLGKTAKALLVQGTGADVYCVWRMVRLIDVPPMVVVFELVALKHAVAAELIGGLKALVAGRRPAVVFLAHESANALLISGPRAVVKEAVEVVGLLGRAAKK